MVMQTAPGVNPATQISDQNVKGVVTYRDDEEKKHAEEIAKNLAHATGDVVNIDQLVPVTEQHPLPQFAQTDVTEEKAGDQQAGHHETHGQEIVDTIKGWQGKNRTGFAKDFLKEKMAWMKKKNKGEEVTLK
jgi:hypothetical protein